MGKRRRRRGGIALSPNNVIPHQYLNTSEFAGWDCLGGSEGGDHTFLGLVLASLGNRISKGTGAPIERAIALLGVAGKRLGNIRLD